ncbi:papain-like cysteine protease family protein [Tropicimonas sp. IMCC6043]|uniref:papain-like cysteine protease family protein n=1 Tax=Tropicimonas sp. IMCC6043 TaxID=2510645 RepID=UPI00101D96DE|nr:papain-like cysteine protease family protein [Tropicimonas sp. IMCC6043]RYH10112.1 hypothetical protein EU800_09500 [Tropicimonas sp. IMCC6043]
MSDYSRCPNPKLRGEPQSIDSMCWFAGYTMLFRWRGMEEKKIREHVWNTLDGAGIDMQDARSTGLKLKDNKKAGMALGLKVRGYGQPVTVHNLRELVRHSPVWATGRWFENTNHVYVIVGVSDDWVEYYDPWYEYNPNEAMEIRKSSTEWILSGDSKTRNGLAHTFQWFPLQYFGR